MSEQLWDYEITYISLAGRRTTHWASRVYDLREAADTFEQLRCVVVVSISRFAIVKEAR